MKILAAALLLIPTLAIAQEVKVIDDGKISVSNPPTVISISQIKIEIDAYDRQIVTLEQAKKDLQNQIDEAAKQGSTEAIAIKNNEVD